MKQKNIMRLVFLLALVLIFSLPGASAKAEAADGGALPGSVTDFQVVLDRDVVKVGDPVNIAINLVDENGMVDLFAGSGGPLGYFAVVESTLNGNFIDNSFANVIADEIDFTQGVAGGHVEFNAPGVAQVRVSVYSYADNGFSSDGNLTQIGTSQVFTVNVSPGADVSVTGLQLVTGSVNAGEAATLKVTAMPADQVNGPVTVKIYDGECNLTTLEGEMVNSVAFIELPAETLTEASCGYNVALSMGTFTDFDSLSVNALAPAKVGIAVTPAYMNDDDTAAAGNDVVATVSLFDKYGNPTAATEETEVEIEATNNVLLDGTSVDTVTISEGSSSTTYDAIAADDDPKPETDDSTGMGTSTLSVSADGLESLGTATITIYREQLAAAYVGSLDFTAGVALDALDVTVPGATITGKMVRVDLYNGSTLVESVTSTIQDGTNGSTADHVSLRFTKALAGSVEGQHFVVNYISSGQSYEPVTMGDTNITVNHAGAVVLKVYQAANAYNPCLGTGTPQQEITSIDTQVGGSGFSIDTPTGQGYYALLLDTFGNTVDETIHWESNNAAPNPVVMSGDLTQNFNYDTAGTDTLTFFSDVPGVDPVAVEVNVAAEAVAPPAPELGSIELVPANDGNLLANGLLPVAVKAYDGDGLPIGWSPDDLTLVISAPDKLTVWIDDFGGFDGSGSRLYNGAPVPMPGSDGSYTLAVLAGGVAGDVTLTVRNDDGSVQGSATIHIVASLDEMPGAVQDGSPAAPLAPVDLGVPVDPSATPVVVGEGVVSIAPQLTVADCADVASVVAYVWMPAANAGVDVSALVTKNCDAGVLTVDFGSIDFTGFPGTYDIYYGYVDGEGAIHYSAYELTVQ